MSGGAMEILTALQQQGVATHQLCSDSRRVVPGDVFLALPGAQRDGRVFIPDAIARGAAAVLCDAGGPVVPASPVPLVRVPDLPAMCGDIAHLVYGRPSEKMWLAGVTGTNGKTSVSQWIAQAMNRLGRKCAVVGTLGNGFPGALQESPNTTPDAVTVHRSLASYLEQGAEACAMEVSSIGLDQGRVNGARFSVAVFTNLSRDHLDYHPTMAAYAEAKARLFEMTGLEYAVLNLDDAFGRRLAERLRGRVMTLGYTLEDATGTDRVLQARELTMDGQGVAFTLDGKRIRAAVVGRFNVSNLLAVIGALLAAEVSAQQVGDVVASLTPPPGRLQTLGGSGQPLLVIDYAHSPDALEKALGALRETANSRGGRLLCLFGCGGDRDAGKRPLMGAVAERLADEVILTSDNPRSEEPYAIIDAIRQGMHTAPHTEIDRALAIARATRDAGVNDVILIAGKGHEPYQEIAGVRRPYSDMAEATSALEARQ